MTHVIIISDLLSISVGPQILATEFQHLLGSLKPADWFQVDEHGVAFQRLIKHVWNVQVSATLILAVTFILFKQCNQVCLVFEFHA